MKLLTKEIEKSLPALYSQEDVEDPLVVVKFFDPCGAATWWITEGGFDGPGYYFFGLCDLGCGYPELGYVSLAELESIEGPLGLGIERDTSWTPKPLSQVRAEGTVA